MTAEHKRMSRMLGYTLLIGTPEAWAGFATVACVRLDLAEWAMLAFFALRALPDETAIVAAAAAIGAAGDPLPAFLGGMQDARPWAALASDRERKAYALAAFEAMAPPDQAEFFRHISTVEVAA